VGLFQRMPEPTTLIPASLSASGYEDGLGRRSLDIDRESGAMLERLQLRPELGAFEAFLRERVAFTAAFEDEGFARVKAIERDGRGALTIVSQFVAGNRLSDLLEAATGLPAHEATCPSVDAALGFLLEVLPSLGSLHDYGGHAHGTLAPGRIVLTPASQVVVLDWLYGPAVQRLQFNRRRLWIELGVAAPSKGHTGLDIAADISQASLAAMMIVLGRPLREEEYPDAISTLVSEVTEIAQIRGSRQFASALEAFLQRTLPVPSRKPHASAVEAAAEVRHIAREIGVSRCRTALTAFVEDMNRVLAEDREHAEGSAATLDYAGLNVAVDEVTDHAAPELTSAHSELDLDVSPVADTVADVAAASFDEFDSSVGSDVFEDPSATETQAPDESPIAEFFARVESAARIRTEPEPVIEEEPAPVPMPEPAAEPVVALEPRRAEIPAITAPVQAAPVAPPVVDLVDAPAPAPTVAPEPVVAPPAREPVTAPAPVVAQPQAPPAPSKPQSKRKRRGSKGQRDKLRSNAAPPKPAATPVQPPPPAAIPMPTFNALPDPSRQPAAGPVATVRPPAQPVAFRPPEPPKPAPAPKPVAPLRLKSDSPAFAGSAPRNERREVPEPFNTPTFGQDDGESAGGFPWKLAAGAIAVIVAVIGIGRAYIPGHSKPPTEAVEAAPAPAPAATEKVEPGKPGTVSIATQPAGAHVLLDGKAVGDSPVTLQGVSSGKHTLTFVTSSGTVKKPIRVEPGKPLVIDVPIYSGWIAVFSPVTLDISENGKPIGTTEQGRLMLSPGRHQLTFTNAEMGYKTTEAVDIDPGEERSVSLVPTGELSANAAPWAEVWINGKKVGETPLGNLHVPLGTHEVVFKNPKFPDRQVTVTVTAKAPAAAFVDFSK
jgi:hypothetical protein